AIMEYSTAADAAHASGDADRERAFRATAEAYGKMFGFIDCRPQVCPERNTMLRTRGASSVEDLEGGMRDVSVTLGSRRHEDMIEVKERIEARLPREPPRSGPLHEEGSTTRPPPHIRAHK